ncbi:MAG: PmoA family protein [Tannerella sp.]|nr:PmoA family protein [Tannerella sp.]
MKERISKIMLLCAVLAVTACCGSGQKGVRLIVDESRQKVDVFFDGKPFTSYIYPDDLEKPVLYPVYTANGTVVTRGFPRDPRPFERIDHPHHVGIWFSFGDVNGLDFWNNSCAIPEDEKLRYGAVRHRQIAHVKNGRDKGELSVVCDWVDHAGSTLLQEDTHFVFGGKDDRRIIERITSLTAHCDTVVFTDSKEGLIAIRADRAFEEPSDRPDFFLDLHGRPGDAPVIRNEGVNGVYRNSEGLENARNVWGKPARWVCLSAEKNGEQISVAILDHPDNPGYPTRWHTRGYGLFAANSMGSRVFDPSLPLFRLTLKRGETVSFRYCIVIKTDGFATDRELDELSEEMNRHNTKTFKTK